MLRFILVFILGLSTFKSFCQDSIRLNPVIYGDGVVSAAFGRTNGIGYGISGNYQLKKTMIAVRYNGSADIDLDIVSLILPIPAIRRTELHSEIALMAGRSFVNYGHFFSVTAGLSYNQFKVYEDYVYPDYHTKYVGIPFDLNIKWFKNSKEQYRIYGLIPVGQPTGLGNSLGLKLYGNISKRSYIALGVTGGIGYHKKYFF